MGRMVLGLGLGLVLLGVVLLLWERGAGSGWRVPGDIEVGGRNWRVSAPLGTGLLISVVLTLVLNLVLWLAGRRH
jgi:hypothetical protein